MVDHTEKAEVEGICSYKEQMQKVAIAFRLIENKHYSNMLNFSAAGFALSSAFKCKSFAAAC